MTHEQIKHKANIVGDWIEYLLNKMVTFEIQTSVGENTGVTNHYVLFRTNNKFRQVGFITIEKEPIENLIFYVLKSVE